MMLTKDLGIRFRSVFTVAIFSMLLLACKSPSNKQEPQKPSNKPFSKENPAVIGVSYDMGGRKDMSFNYGVSVGAAKASQEFPIKLLEVDNRTENDVESNMISMLDQGVELLISVGITSRTTLEKIAKEYPQKKFAFIDGTLDLPNVRSIIFDDAEGSFLAGYLAGLVTKTNKVGFIGGMQIPLIIRFYTGYAAGVMTANPNATVLTPKYLGGWDNIDLAKTAANYLYNQGADIIYSASGKATLGVLGAAKSNNKYAIGIDSDQDHIQPGHVLTSMIKAVDVATYQTIKEFVEGHFTPGVKKYGVKENGVRLSPMKYTKNIIGKENIAKVDHIRQQLAEGKIKVPNTEAELKEYIAHLPKHH